MGVSIGDYNRDGLLDIVKTNFAGDTDSLYMNLGDGSFDDRTYQAGLGINTRLLGWGVSFIDVTTTAGSTFSLPTVMSIPKWTGRR